MPWVETNVREQRLHCVIAAMRPGANKAAVFRAFGVSRKTGDKWVARHQEAGILGLADRSRRPQHSPTRTDDATTARVREARAIFGWGGEKLAVVLRAQGLAVSARTVDRIIQREGLTRRDAGPGPALRRFEHAAPNDLWQLDAKGHYPLAPAGRCHPLTVLDDHSRFVVALEALPTLTRAAVQPALIRCFERYGLPDALLMDHGTPWWDAGHAAGLTQLGVFLIDQGIRLLHGRVRHPQTQGKVERFHRTLAERLRWVGVPTTLRGFRAAFDWMREEYNELRPHAARGQEPPAWHYTPSGRAYQPRPQPWASPVGADVRRIDTAGMLSYAGRRYFISGALQRHEVWCQCIEDRVLVTYRDMTIRELQLQTGRSVLVLTPYETRR